MWYINSKECLQGSGWAGRTELDRDSAHFTLYGFDNSFPNCQIIYQEQCLANNKLLINMLGKLHGLNDKNDICYYIITSTQYVCHFVQHKGRCIATGKWFT